MAWKCARPHDPVQRSHASGIRFASNRGIERPLSATSRYGRYWPVSDRRTSTLSRPTGMRAQTPDAETVFSPQGG